MTTRPNPPTDSGPAGARCRLATYGSLAPGRPNHHQLDGLRGAWFEGSVRGQLIQDGWGATLGYPAIVLDLVGPVVPVQVFESQDLPDHWERLDQFEGPGYVRVTVSISTPEGDVDAFIYALRQP